jgi:hypothetical protein
MLYKMPEKCFIRKVQMIYKNDKMFSKNYKMIYNDDAKMPYKNDEKMPYNNDEKMLSQ